MEDELVIIPSHFEGDNELHAAAEKIISEWRVTLGIKIANCGLHQQLRFSGTVVSAATIREQEQQDLDMLQETFSRGHIASPAGPEREHSIQGYAITGHSGPFSSTIFLAVSFLHFIFDQANPFKSILP